MSQKRQIYPCTLACELTDGARSHIGRLRWISLSYCFVEVEGLDQAEGREVALRIPGSGQFQDARVSAIVSSDVREVPVSGIETCRGVDLALQQVDGHFFCALESIRRQASEPPTQPQAQPQSQPEVERAVPTPAPEATCPETPVTGSGQRRAERREVHIPVRLWGGGQDIAGTIRNISKHGAYVQTPTPIPANSELHVELELPTRSFHYEGIVVNQRQAGDGATEGVGVRFVPIEEMLDTAPKGEKLRAARPLSLDLRDPAQLARVYLGEIRHGGLCLRTADRYLEGAEVRVEVQLPPPHAPLAVLARVLPGQTPERLMVELLEPTSVKERVRAIIEEHRSR